MNSKKDDNTPCKYDENDIFYIRRAMEIAEQAKACGSLPIGCLIVLNGKIIAEGKNQVLSPVFQPGSHAEVSALYSIDWREYHNFSKEMTLYTNIEPCIMCFGAIIIYRVGRVVFGATDPNRGATYLTSYIDKIYRDELLPQFVGPVLQEECIEMFKDADIIYRKFRDRK